MPDNALQVRIGEREFTFSPITLGVMRKFKLLDDFKVASQIRGALPSDSEIDAMLRILHASATIAEPALTFDEFCVQGLDTLPFIEGVTAMSEVLPTVLNASGFVRAQGGDTVGEAPGSQS